MNAPPAVLTYLLGIPWYNLAYLRLRVDDMVEELLKDAKVNVRANDSKFKH